MKKITSITRHNIFDLFRNGLECPYTEEKLQYVYFGRLSEIDFLRRLYPIEKMHSRDKRFKTLEDEIIQHRINNDDYEENWIFYDDRFELLNGDDSKFLTFLTLIFNPEVRVENSSWKEFFDHVNKLLKIDGYELYADILVSDKILYSWRRLSDVEIKTKKFAPFSLRHRAEILSKKLTISIPKKFRIKILNLFNKFNADSFKTTETGWTYDIQTKNEIVTDLNEYYPTKAFNENGIYSDTKDLDSFILSTLPSCVFDAIEIFAAYNRNNNFQEDINKILNDFSYELKDGKIELSMLSLTPIAQIEEKGLKELVDTAYGLFINSAAIDDKKLAVDKIWDSFERIKSLYNTNKKRSVSILVAKIANDDKQMFELLDKEFNELTRIGNNFNIRHYEIRCTEIKDVNYLEYFFHRCYILLRLAIKFVNTDNNLQKLPPR